MEQTLENKGRYLLATATGERTMESMRRGHVEIARACRRHGLDRVLVDSRGMTGDLSPVDLYELVGTLDPVGRAGVRRMAVVRTGRPGEEFAETVAQNRGYDMRMFLEYDEALAWLLAD